jgi:beta-N-acetylhexosaminidase
VSIRIATSIAALAVLCTAGLGASSGRSAVAERSLLAGRSVEKHAIEALASGSASARVRVLVVGSIHGNEPAGHAVIRRLRAARPPRDVQLWTLRSANPDGVERGTRHNARGVDLNRNFGHRWRRQGAPFSPFHSGQRPFSEPESRAIRRLVMSIRPDVTVWYHQALRVVDTGSGADRRLVRRYAGVARLRAGPIGFLPGVATRWQNNRFPRSSAFVVELPGGRLGDAAAARHARAVRAVARLALRLRRPAAATTARPRIHQWRIPFGPRRKADMRRYARRHYGVDDHRLLDPRVVVLHLSVSDTARSVYDTFAPNRPDAELGELPGLCAHFVIDGRGRIFQLVSLRLMCRHTVGLNHVSFGIEHVGRREADVFRRTRQLGASLRLVRWLRDRYGIRLRNVIGHNESRESPYHRERVARLRDQTHGDFPRRLARRYRRLLIARSPRPALSAASMAAASF